MLLLISLCTCQLRRKSKRQEVSFIINGVETALTFVDAEVFPKKCAKMIINSLCNLHLKFKLIHICLFSLRNGFSHRGSASTSKTLQPRERSWWFNERLLGSPDMSGNLVFDGFAGGAKLRRFWGRNELPLSSKGHRIGTRVIAISGRIRS